MGRSRSIRRYAPQRHGTENSRLTQRLAILRKTSAHHALRGGSRGACDSKFAGEGGFRPRLASLGSRIIDCCSISGASRVINPLITQRAMNKIAGPSFAPGLKVFHAWIGVPDLLATTSCEDARRVKISNSYGACRMKKPHYYGNSTDPVSSKTGTYPTSTEVPLYM